MKCLFIIIFATLAAVQLPAATNGTPVKLAIVPESADAAAAADVLTAEHVGGKASIWLMPVSQIEEAHKTFPE